jgi:hypothetical protein
VVLFKDASGTDEVVVDLSPLRQPADAPALAAAMAGAEAEGSEASALAVASVLAEWSAVWGGEWAGESPAALAPTFLGAEVGSATSALDGGLQSSRGSSGNNNENTDGRASVAPGSTAALAPSVAATDAALGVARLEVEVQAAAQKVRALKAQPPLDAAAVAAAVAELLDLKCQLAAATLAASPVVASVATFAAADGAGDDDAGSNDGGDEVVAGWGSLEEWRLLPIYRLPEQATRWHLPRPGAKQLAKALASHLGTTADGAAGAGAGFGGKGEQKQGGSLERGMPRVKPGKSRRSGGFGIG